jgi:hypothetical protein
MTNKNNQKPNHSHNPEQVTPIKSNDPPDPRKITEERKPTREIPLKDVPEKKKK